VADTIGHLLAAACQRFRDRPALLRGHQTRTYGELLERGARLASALRGAGLEPGTSVAAMLEDRIESLEVYLGAFFGGYPVIHVNDRLAAPEVAHILADSGARALFHTDGRSEVVDASGARDATAVLVTIGADRPPGAEGFEDVVSQARSVPKIAPRSAGDLAIVGYTSGTTGLPKGAMISQRALTACVRLMPSMFRISPYGRCAFTGTLSFVSGIWGVILPHLYTGGTVTFLHPYTPQSWADHVEADRSTFTYAPSPLIPAFAAELRQRPAALRALESVIHSGSPVPRAHVADLVDVIGERYTEVWGMTEGVAPFSATVRGDWRGESRAQDVYASAGRAFPTATIQAVGADGQVLPPGEEGELTVRADIAFDGYLGDPALTQASWGPHGLRTGDLGRLDPAGLCLRHRAGQGPDHQRRHERLPGRGGGGAGHLAGGGRVRGPRAAGRALGRGGHRGGRARARRGADRRPGHRVRADADRRLQAAAAGALYRAAAAQCEHEGAQGPAA
jgi:acyl-CoA synthetase (AMP-forming)/AMP-acid ligase II